MAQSDIILPTERLHELPAVRTITLTDLRDALAKGLDDFWAMPTHVISFFHLLPASLSSAPLPRLDFTN